MAVPSARPSVRADGRFPRQSPVIVSDMPPIRCGPIPDLALAHGLRACWSTPILSSESKVLGPRDILSRAS